MTEHPRNDQQEAALRQALGRAVDDVTPAPDALSTIRTRIERGEGRLSVPARFRAAAGDTRWRLLARTRPGSRSATHAAAGGHGLAAGDYVPPGSSTGGVRSRGRKAVMAIAGVFAVLTTGLAVNQLTAADGAASPEAAVHDFFDAIDQEDPLGVLESLTPSERQVLVPSVRRLAEQLKRFDVADEGLDLEHVDGLDLQVQGLTLRTQGLHPDVAVVQVTGGTITTSANFRELPLGRTLAAALDEEGGQDLDEPLNDSIPLDLNLATLRTGDRWHVSLLYSVAENMRAHDGAPVPHFGNGIPARGADSPQGAVDAMVGAYNEQDFTRMIELTPLDTAAVLHDYGPVLLDDQAGSSSTVFEDISFAEPRGSGGRRTLTVDSYRMIQSYDGEPEFTIVYDGSCITTTWSESAMSSGRLEPDTVCVDDPSTGVNLGFGLAPGSLGVLLFGPGQAEIVVVERDGAWYVDPALSAVETLLVDIERATPGQINLTVEQWAASANGDDDAWYATTGPSFYRYCPGEQAPADDAPFEERKAAGLRCAEEQYGGDGESVTPTTSMGPEFECQRAGDAEAVEACLQGLGDSEALALHHTTVCSTSSLVPSEVETCLQDLVDEGKIDPVEVARYRCHLRYEDLGKDDLEAFDAAVERCLEDAGVGDDQPDEVPLGPPATLAPPTTTG